MQSGKPHKATGESPLLFFMPTKDGGLIVIRRKTSYSENLIFPFGQMKSGNVRPVKRTKTITKEVIKC